MRRRYLLFLLTLRVRLVLQPIPRSFRNFFAFLSPLHMMIFDTVLHGRFCEEPLTESAIA